MHKPQDENGNSISNGHGEEGHDHHDQAPLETKEQIVALLSYMCEHNKAHGVELNKMVVKMEELAMRDAALQLKKAVNEYGKGTLLMEQALSIAKGD